MRGGAAHIPSVSPRHSKTFRFVVRDAGSESRASMGSVFLRTPTFRRRAAKSPSAPPRQSAFDFLRSSAHGFRVPSDSDLWNYQSPARAWAAYRRPISGSESQAIAPLRLFNLRQPPRSLTRGFRVPSDSDLWNYPRRACMYQIPAMTSKK